MAKKEIEKKKFEELIEELEVIVKDLEAGNTDLDETIKKYTEAMKIAKVCNDKLENATTAVNKILNENGELTDFEINAA